MLTDLFLGMSLLGAEWVLLLLLLLSVLSFAIIVERYRFYKAATADLTAFRQNVREAASRGEWQLALTLTNKRKEMVPTTNPDFETGLIRALVDHQASASSQETEVLQEIAQDALLRTRVRWDKHLTVLATIGNNAPFIGLFGTVLGIIQAFHHLSASGGGAQSVTAGLADALIATAIGILVAIPAVVAFNFFTRRVREALSEAEALKSYLIGKMVKK